MNLKGSVSQQAGPGRENLNFSNSLDGSPNCILFYFVGQALQYYKLPYSQTLTCPKIGDLYKHVGNETFKSLLP